MSNDQVKPKKKSVNSSCTSGALIIAVKGNWSCFTAPISIWLLLFAVQSQWCSTVWWLMQNCLSFTRATLTQKGPCSWLPLRAWPAVSLYPKSVSIGLEERCVFLGYTDTCVGKPGRPNEPIIHTFPHHLIPAEMNWNAESYTLFVFLYFKTAYSWLFYFVLQY